MARRISVEIVGDSRSVERAFKRAGNSASGFRRTIGGVAKGVGVGLGGAFVAAGFAMRAGFKELAESQKVAAQTNAVMRSTGGVANVSAKQVGKLANSLSRKSGIDDEAIASGENMLLTFTNIRNGLRKNDKIFNMATATVLDMSVALGKDIPSTAIMVGKALNDLEVNSKGTITGWSALRRVGVKVSSSMMDQAAAFIKAGKPMEAQKLLLKELTTEFGGSAKAFGTTMPGALGRLRNAFDELMAAFATGFLPMILKVSRALTTKLADPAFVERVRELGRVVGDKLLYAFSTISNWFQDHWEEIKSAFRTGAAIAKTMAQAVGRIYGWFQKLASIAPGGGQTLMGMIVGGILLSKIGLLNKALLLMLRRTRLIGKASAGGTIGGGGRGGGKRIGGGGKGGKAPFMPLGGPLAVATAVLSAGGGGTQRGDRSGQYPMTFAAWRKAARGKLGPRKLKILQDALRGYSLANAPDEAMTNAERRLRGLKNVGLPGHLRPGTHGGDRAGGGPVTPGVSYRVGERGPEMFTPGMRGNISPSGAGGITINGPVHLHGVQNPQQLLKQLQRKANSTAASRRGVYGGAAMNLG